MPRLSCRHGFPTRFGSDWILRCLILIGMLGFKAPAAPAAFGVRPNIVLVMTDDQGYGELGCHGNPILKTPNLDRLHGESLRFTDFHVSPTCSPTRASLLTGRHEFRSGVTHTIFERERLSLGATTIAEVLSKAGYRTGIFGKWHLGDEAEYQPGRRGFQEVFIHGGGGIGQTYPGSCGDVPDNGYFHPVVRHNGRFERTHGYCTDVFFSAAESWIATVSSNPAPFFALITPNAPHGPLISPGDSWEAPYRAAGLKDVASRYYAMIANIDANVGRLLDSLRDRRLETNTLVIFMTDNGHGFTGLFNAGMRGTKATPYQGGTRVPSFWRWKGVLPSGADCRQLAAHIDLLPTLAELAGAVPGSPGLPAALDGRSLVPLLRNPAAPWPDRRLFIHVGRWETGQSASARLTNCAVRTARYRFVNNAELYDILADPSESTNVASAHPEIVAELREAYARWWHEVLPSTVENEIAVGPPINPFKRDYWAEFPELRDPELFNRMDPAWKFNPSRPAF